MFSRIKIEIISGLYDDFLNYLIENEFYISSVKSTDFGITVICNASDYRTIARAARRFQCRTKIVKRKGIAFFIRKIFKRSIKYDSSTKSFIKNPSCKLKFAIRSISLDKIQKVRIRYVKKGYLDGQYSLNDMGKFYVISFDSANKEESLSVWSIKKGNLDDFIPIIENAFNENSLSIQIDRNDTLMSGKDFKDGK